MLFYCICSHAAQFNKIWIYFILFYSIWFNLVSIPLIWCLSLRACSQKRCWMMMTYPIFSTFRWHRTRTGIRNHAPWKWTLSYAGYAVFGRYSFCCILYTPTVVIFFSYYHKHINCPISCKNGYFHSTVNLYMWEFIQNNHRFYVWMIYQLTDRW